MAIGSKITQALIAKLGLDQREFRREFRAANKFAASVGKRMARTFKRVALAVAAITTAVAVMGVSFTKAVIKAADTSEQFRIRLSALLGSAEEGGKIFDSMAKFAAKVPFEFEQILAGATQLASVVKDGAKEIEFFIPIIADLAAVSGLTFDQTTQQMVRALSAGIGSADLFRERGVAAMLGFQAGATTSAKETREVIIREFEKAGSKFRGASADLAKTWTGLMSLLKDRWFQFKNIVANAGLFDAAKDALELLIQKLQKLADAGKLEEIGKRLSDGIQEGVVLGVRAIGKLGLKLVELVDFFRTQEIAGGAGLVGFLLFGPLGLAAGVTLGLAVNKLIAAAAGPTSVAGAAQAELESLITEFRELVALRERVKAGFSELQLRLVDPATIPTVDELTEKILFLADVIEGRKRTIAGFGAEDFAELGSTTSLLLENGRELFDLFANFNIERMQAAVVAGRALNGDIGLLNQKLPETAFFLEGIAELMEESKRLLAESIERTESWKRRMESLGDTIENQMIGGLAEVILQLDDMLGTIRSIGRAILREIVANLIRAAAAGQSLSSVLSAAGPLGAIGAGIGILSSLPFFADGGVVRNQPSLAVAGGAQLAGVHPGEVILNTATVGRLGGAAAANSLNSGEGGGESQRRELVIRAEDIPEPTDFGMIATKPQAQRLVAEILRNLSANGFEA